MFPAPGSVCGALVYGDAGIIESLIKMSCQSHSVAELRLERGNRFVFLGKH